MPTVNRSVTRFGKICALQPTAAFGSCRPTRGRRPYVCMQAVHGRVPRGYQRQPAGSFDLKKSKLSCLDGYYRLAATAGVASAGQAGRGPAQTSVTTHVRARLDKCVLERRNCHDKALSEGVPPRLNVAPAAGVVDPRVLDQHCKGCGVRGHFLYAIKSGEILANCPRFATVPEALCLSPSRCSPGARAGATAARARLRARATAPIASLAATLTSRSPRLCALALATPSPRHALHCAALRCAVLRSA
jgi:hypothetical protein